MRFLLVLVFTILSACTPDGEQTNSGNGELWVMVKIDSNFRTQRDLDLVDLVAKQIEGKKLGFLDGHSSGAYQLDFNFIDISDFEAAREEITKTIETKFPTIDYSISSSYEAKYEKL